ncbi:MAG TPA: aldose epimerase family protein [Solirubrobacteraceae bacterium]
MGRRQRHSRHGSASITSQPWGSAEGHAVNLHTLDNGRGMTVAIADYGGIVQSIKVADRGGDVADVALGFADLDGYLANNSSSPGPSGATYFGAIVGRYANRIADGSFTLDGQTYTLPRNNGANTLHGGPNAWNTKLWQVAPGGTPESPSLALSYTDPAGADGFPGMITARVVYSLVSSSALRIDYTATTDAATVLAPTNHTYFNLAGEGSGVVLDHELVINADGYTPINSHLIPTGDVEPVAGTPLDFRAAKPIGRDIADPHPQIATAQGFDHNFALNGTDGELAFAARAFDPTSGRVLTTWTTEPGIQLYSANFLRGDLIGPSGRRYERNGAFALETQHFPNSPNEPGFPSTVLRPGQTLRSTTIYAFSVARSSEEAFAGLDARLEPPR